MSTVDSDGHLSSEAGGVSQSECLMMVIDACVIAMLSACYIDDDLHLSIITLPLVCRTDDD